MKSLTTTRHPLSVGRIAVGHGGNCLVPASRFRSFVHPLLPKLWMASALACGTLAIAQPSGRPSATAAARAAARAENFEDALAWIAKGDLAAADASLSKDNIQRSGTLESDIESAVRLTHAALVLRERCTYRSANLAASRALALLADVKRDRFTAAPPRRRAEAYEVTGFIYEYLLDDPSAAKDAYERALRESAGSKAAQAGLDRVNEREKQVDQLRGRKG